MCPVARLLQERRPDCERSLPFTAFHRNRRRVDGLAFYCKECAAVRSEGSRRKRGISERRKAPLPLPPGHKWCPDCESAKPFEAFARTTASASGYHSYCRPCHNQRGQETRQRLYGGSRHYHSKRRYGIGADEVDALIAEQGGVCAICGVAEPAHVDHDHLTGTVRGVLCFNCNGGLGQFRDRVDVMRKAITYLEGTTWQRVLVQPGVYRWSSPRRASRPSPTS